MLTQQTMRGTDAQRAEPQPPQPLARKRTVEPQRRRPLAAAAARDEDRCRRRRRAGETRTRAPTQTQDRATARHRPPQHRSVATLSNSPSIANAISRTSSADPWTSSSSRAAESARRCGTGNRSSPSGNTGLNRSARAANENSVSALAGRHANTAMPRSRAPPPPPRTTSSFRSPPPRRGRAPLARLPRRKKPANIATSASRPTTRPRSHVPRAWSEGRPLETAAPTGSGSARVKRRSRRLGRRPPPQSLADFAIARHGCMRRGRSPRGTLRPQRSGLIAERWRQATVLEPGQCHALERARLLHALSRARADHRRLSAAAGTWDAGLD